MATTHSMDWPLDEVPNEYEEAAEFLRAEETAADRLRRGLCPDCGSEVRRFYRPNNFDPGDVDPAADCTNPSCGWGY